MHHPILALVGTPHLDGRHNPVTVTVTIDFSRCGLLVLWDLGVVFFCWWSVPSC